MQLESSQNSRERPGSICTLVLVKRVNRVNRGPAARIVANSREVRVDVGEEGGGGVVLVGGGAYGRLPEYAAFF
jgi:hypothetical protein